jgi:hypothetical protein
MSRFTRTASLLAIGAAIVASTPSTAQTFRMMLGLGAGTGFGSEHSVVTCTDTRGFAHRTGRAFTFYLNPSGQGAGKEAAIQGALQAWTNVTNADHLLEWGGTRSNGYRQADGLNMLVWGIDAFCDTKSCHAVTALLIAPGQEIRETDILFNANPNRNFQWMINGQYSPDCAQTANSNGLMLDTQGIATHELGHALGIHHPSNYTTSAATMANVACTVNGRTLEADDREALRCSENRYPDAPVYEGAFEVAGCRAMTGWAWNADRSYQKSYVEIVEDLPNGTVKVHAVTPANRYRADLTWLPDRYHAFSWDPRGSDLDDARWHAVRARYSGNQANVGPTHMVMCGLEMFPQSMNPSDPPLSTGGQPYEVGTQFKSDVPGYITEIAYHWSPGEAAAVGTKTAKLWTDSGQLLASATLRPPVIFGQAGWSSVSIPRVAIQANVKYRASVDTYAYQSKSSCGSSTSLSSPYVNSPLTALQGFWRSGVGSMPTVGSCSNFFVSVKYESG